MSETNCTQLILNHNTNLVLIKCIFVFVCKSRYNRTRSHILSTDKVLCFMCYAILFCLFLFEMIFTFLFFPYHFWQIQNWIEIQSDWLLVKIEFMLFFMLFMYRSDCRGGVGNWPSLRRGSILFKFIFILFDIIPQFCSEYI